MFHIKDGVIEATAPSMAEVKELYIFVRRYKSPAFDPLTDMRDARPLLTDADALADLNGTARPDWPAGTPEPEPAAPPLSIETAKAVQAVTEQPMQEVIDNLKQILPFNAANTYKDGDSALIGDKVFTKHKGQWIDPSAIPVAELEKHEAETADPKQIFGAHSTAGAEASPTAPVDTPAASSIPTPPAAPVPPAPSPEVTAPAPTAHAAPSSPANGVMLDKRGLPWDARIHSSSKAILSNGNWRNMRGVDAALVAQVEAELYATMKAAPAAPVPVGQAPVAPVVPAPPSAEADPTDFASLVMLLSDLQLKGRITKEQIGAVVNDNGLAALPVLANRPDLVAPVWQGIKALLV
jgi:hypothetical protein